jgi:hypothetical protein
MLPPAFEVIRLIENWNAELTLPLWPLLDYKVFGSRSRDFSHRGVGDFYDVDLAVVGPFAVFAGRLADG